MSSQTSTRLTKRQRKLSEKSSINSIKQQNMQLKHIEPMTENQEKVFEAYQKGHNLFLHGCAGTGKTFIALWLGLKELESQKTKKNKIVIIRSAQSSKDIGFLPGSEKQKLEVYEGAYRGICSELFGRADAYDVLKSKGIIEFHSTSFWRGSTIDDAIIIFDEVQNTRYSEFRTILTRVGNNARIILCGDSKQDDLTSERFKEQSGIQEMMKVFTMMNMISVIHFTIDDIVRSGFVKDFLIAEYTLGIY